MWKTIKNLSTIFLVEDVDYFLKFSYNKDLDIFEASTKDGKYITVDHYLKNIDETTLTINIYKPKKNYLFKKAKYYGSDSFYRYTHRLSLNEYQFYLANDFKFEILMTVVYEALLNSIITYASFDEIAVIDFTFKQHPSVSYTFIGNIPVSTFNAEFFVLDDLKSVDFEYALIDEAIYKKQPLLLCEKITCISHIYETEFSSKIATYKSILNNNYYWHYSHDSFEVDLHYKDGILLITEYRGKQMSKHIFYNNIDISNYFNSFYAKIDESLKKGKLYMVYKKTIQAISNVFKYNTYCLYDKVYSNKTIDIYHSGKFILVKNKNGIFSIFKNLCSSGGGAVVVKVYDSSHLLMSFSEWVIPSVAMNMNDVSKSNTLSFFENHVLSNYFMNSDQVTKFYKVINQFANNELAFIKFHSHELFLGFLKFKLEVYYFASVSHVSYSNQELEGCYFMVIMTDNDLLIEETNENDINQQLIKNQFIKYTKLVNLDFFNSVNDNSILCQFHHADLSGFIKISRRDATIKVVKRYNIGQEVSYIYSVKDIDTQFLNTIYKILHFFIIHQPSDHLKSLLKSSALTLHDISDIDCLSLIEMLDI